MEDVTANQPEFALEIERGMNLACEYACPEVGGMGSDRVDDMVGDFLADIVPAASVGELWRELLAEQACDIRTGRREAVVDGRRDLHLDDRRARPAKGLRIGVSAAHIVEARRAPCREAR